MENLKHKVKTWCESTKEGENYLKYNGYGKVERVGKSDIFKTEKIGNELRDVFIVS